MTLSPKKREMAYWHSGNGRDWPMPMPAQDFRVGALGTQGAEAEGVVSFGEARAGFVVHEVAMIEGGCGEAKRFVEEELSRQADAQRTETGVDDAPRTINDLIRAYHQRLHRLQDFDVPDAEFEVFGVRAADDQQRRAARAQSAYADLIADGADMDTIRDEVRRIERPSGRYSGNPRGNRTSAQAAERLTADLFSPDEELVVDRATVEAAAADHRESSIDHNDDTGRADPYDLAI